MITFSNYVVGNKQYTIGKLYHFGHTLEAALAGSKIGAFTAYYTNKKLFQCTTGLGKATPAYKFMVEINEGLLGKVEDKPIELHDGSFYLISLKSHRDASKIVVEFKSETRMFETHDYNWEEDDVSVHAEMGRIQQ